MRRTILFCGLTFLVGLFLGLFFHTWFPTVKDVAPTAPMAEIDTPVSAIPPIPTATAPQASPEPSSAQEPVLSDNRRLLNLSLEVLDVLRARDYGALAAYAHASGVRFTPYSTVDFSQDLVLTSGQIAEGASDTQTYTWGAEDGSGTPLTLTIPDYFARFVYNADYTEAPRIGINQVIQSGNALENVTEAYPDGQFVDFNFSRLDPDRQGMDWCSLKLVFLPDQGELKLAGIIHGQWTV